jgi:hypothetical protein
MVPVLRLQDVELVLNVEELELRTLADVDEVDDTTGRVVVAGTVGDRGVDDALLDLDRGVEL